MRRLLLILIALFAMSPVSGVAHAAPAPSPSPSPSRSTHEPTMDVVDDYVPVTKPERSSPWPLLGAGALVLLGVAGTFWGIRMHRRN